MSFSPEELAAESVARSNHLEVAPGNENGSAIMSELNMDPLPRKDMTLQGAKVQEGGTIDQVVRRRRYMLLGVMATAVVITLGVTIPLVMARNATRSYATSAANSSNGPDMTGHDLLLDEDELAQEEIEEVVFVTPNFGGNDAMLGDDQDAQQQEGDDLGADEVTALQQARREGILTKLAEVSDFNLLTATTTPLSPQFRAAQWIIDDDSMMLNAEEDATRLVQRYVVALLYYALDGDNWTSSNNFLTFVSECQWQGVDCAAFSHTVNRIQLGNNTLEGSIPSEIGHLANVVHLNLENNMLHGDIPLGIYQNMTSLKYLDLSDNMLSGSLSDEVKNLAEHIREINLHKNALGGTLPASAFEHLTQLQTLKLYDNDMTGNLPSELGLMTRLKRLDVDENNFKGSIPYELGHLTEMEVLWLNANTKLTGTLPEGIWSNMTKLQKLVLGNMNLTGSIPDSLSNLVELEYLQLTKNNFEGSIPESIGALTKLRGLELSRNNFQGPLPTSMGNLPSLQLVYISHNAIGSNIPKEWSNMTNLTTLIMSNSNVTGPLPAELGSLSKLQYLMVDRNELTSELPDEIGNLEQLSHLYLYENNFKGQIPSTMGNLKSLREFIIDQNEFTGTVPPELGNLSNLNTMFLYQNKFNGKVPDPICELRDVSSLKYLWADCQQTGFNCTCCTACCESQPGYNGCYYVTNGRTQNGERD